MNELDIPFISITQRIIVKKKVMNEIRKCTISRQVYNTLITWNRPLIVAVHGLPINLTILVYWKGNIG